MTVLSDAPARDPVPAPGNEARAHRLIVAATGVVLLMGLGCYFWTRSDMWLDEALSVNIARLPIHDLRDALRHDGAPPLYYVLLHVWTAVFGTGDVGVRSLSAVCMIGAAVATWFAARRVGGEPTAWIAVVVIASNPYAIRYATEARMYGLEMALVAWGIVAFQRALEAPTLDRLAVLALVAVLLVYTQYWALYLLLVVAALLVYLAWRRRHRDAARRMLVALALAGLTFVPWLPTFFYQRAHTGTPWGTPILPGIPLGYTLRDFAGGDQQEAWVLFFPLVTLLLLGLFARGVDERRIEVDVRAQRAVRGLAFVGVATLVVALVLNYLGGGAFQSRYSSIVFPIFVVLVARGVTILLDARLRLGVLAVVVVLGFVGGGRNMFTQRTEAGRVATVLRAEAHPGDLVVYCPDQVGPGVHRLVPRGLDEVTYPAFGSSEFVDWVDYKARLAHVDLRAFAQRALRRAGSHTLWFVSAPGYITHRGTCEALSDRFARSRPRELRVASDEKLFEMPGLQEFAAPAPGG